MRSLADHAIIRFGNHEIFNHQPQVLYVPGYKNIRRSVTIYLMFSIVVKQVHGNVFGFINVFLEAQPVLFDHISEIYSKAMKMRRNDRNKCFITVCTSLQWVNKVADLISFKSFQYFTSLSFVLFPTSGLVLVSFCFLSFDGTYYIFLLTHRDRFKPSIFLYKLDPEYTHEPFSK